MEFHSTVSNGFSKLTLMIIVGGGRGGGRKLSLNGVNNFLGSNNIIRRATTREETRLLKTDKFMNNLFMMIGQDSVMLESFSCFSCLSWR